LAAGPACGSSTADPEKIAAILKNRYHLGDTVIVGRARDITREAVRLLRPILAGFRRHSKSLYFGVDADYVVHLRS
jgi:Ni,Fe-hydrogenase III large subunit